MSLAGKDPALSAIHISIHFDKRLWQEDIDGSRAHLRMLGEQGILPAEEVEVIREGLGQVEAEIREGRFEFRPELEDIHFNVEHRLIELIGPVGGKLHTGRSRNDQVATDLRLWLLRQRPALLGALEDLSLALLEAADRELERGTILPFYTHLQRAQPVMLAHHLHAHVVALGRDAGRLRDALSRASECPLGAGPGGGSGFSVDPARSAELLGFERACRNSLDAVAARDFVAESLAALAILMTHLSRLAEELILWSSQEFGFVSLSDKVTTWSSIMPQKRNPDGAELVRGKTGRVFGHLQTVLVMLKALPFAYNKDLQEDKEALFDAVDTVLLSLQVSSACIREASFHRETMRAAIEARAGYANATELADYLAARGVPFREAYGITSALVKEARGEEKSLAELGIERLQQAHEAIKPDLIEALTTEAAIARRSAPMGTAPSRVKRALEAARVDLASQSWS